MLDSGILNKELSEIYANSTKDLSLDSHKILAIAEWIAKKYADTPSSGKGLEIAINERSGRCGVRSRLFVALVNHIHCEAQIFGMYNSKLRHTVSYAKIDGSWCFIDPMYGVCFIDDSKNYLNFNDYQIGVQNDAANIELLDFYFQDPDDSNRMQFLRKKAQQLYCKENISTAKSFGLLYDNKSPIEFFPEIDLSNVNFLTAKADINTETTFEKSVAKNFKAFLPNFLGSTNKSIIHHWNFINCIDKEPVLLKFVFDVVPKKRIDLEIETTDAKLISSKNIRLIDKEVTIEIYPNEVNCEVVVRSKFHGWACAVKILEIHAGYKKHIQHVPLKLSAILAGYKKHIQHVPLKLSAILAGYKKHIQHVPLEESDPEELLVFLTEKSTISKLVSNGTFSSYKKRPHNWTWVFHGTAAIFAFRCSDDMRFLDWVFYIFKDVSKSRDFNLGRMDDLRGRSYKSWGAQVDSKVYGKDMWINEVCTASCMLLPALLAACEAHSDLKLRKKYKEEIDLVLQTAKECMEEFYEDIFHCDKLNASYFIMPHDGEAEPTAHVAPFVVCSAAMYFLTQQKHYYDMGEKIANYFKQSITTTGSSWHWPYRPTPGKMKGEGEFFFKARVTMLMPIHCYRLGQFFKESDLKEFSNTFKKSILRSGEDCFTTTSVINGKPVEGAFKKKYIAKGRVGSLTQIAGYYPLAAFDEEVGFRLEKYIANQREIFPKGFWTSPSSVEAYAVRMSPIKSMIPLKNSTQKTINLPKVPLEIAKLASRETDAWRSYRASYDWKAYDAEQLKEMEKYWDSVITLYQGLLPERLQKNTEVFKGINLGTFNGAYQKAWMRIGYQMFGVEYCDSIEELKEYGCQGIQANFFNLHEIHDKSFDFAVLDRALFLKKSHAYFYSAKEDRYIELRHDRKDKILSSKNLLTLNYSKKYHRNFFERGGNFFKEMFRIIKDDGVFLGILYPYWSSIAMKELFSYGEVTLKSLEGRYFLVIMVDRSKPPSNFLTAEEFISSIRDEEDILNAIQTDQFIGKTLLKDGKSIKFHYLPTNEFVDFDIEHSCINKIIKAVDLDIKGSFFQDEEDIILFKDSPLKKKRNNKVIAILGPRFITGRPTKESPLLKKLLTCSSTLMCKKNLDSSDKIKTYTELSIKALLKTDADLKFILITNPVADSVINIRSGRPINSLKKSIANTKYILSKIPKGFYILLMIPYSGNVPGLEKIQGESLNEFRKGYLDEFASNVDLLDLSDVDQNFDWSLGYRDIIGGNEFQKSVANLVSSYVNKLHTS